MGILSINFAPWFQLKPIGSIDANLWIITYKYISNSSSVISIDRRCEAIVVYTFQGLNFQIVLLLCVMRGTKNSYYTYSNDQCPNTNLRNDV